LPPRHQVGRRRDLEPVRLHHPALPEQVAGELGIAQLGDSFLTYSIPTIRRSLMTGYPGYSTATGQSALGNMSPAWFRRLSASGARCGGLSRAKAPEAYQTTTH
jgi:hypothetical protein